MWHQKGEEAWGKGEDASPMSSSTAGCHPRGSLKEMPCCLTLCLPHKRLPITCGFSRSGEPVWTISGDHLCSLPYQEIKGPRQHSQHLRRSWHSHISLAGAGFALHAACWAFPGFCLRDCVEPDKLYPAPCQSAWAFGVDLLGEMVFWVILSYLSYLDPSVPELFGHGILRSHWKVSKSGLVWICTLSIALLVFDKSHVAKASLESLILLYFLRAEITGMHVTLSFRMNILCLFG